MSRKGGKAADPITVLARKPVAALYGCILAHLQANMDTQKKGHVAV